MRARPILLIEDNEDDELLTLRSLKRANIANDVVVMRDGQQALDFLLREGAHADRSDELDPALILLDLKLPKVDGLDVLADIPSYESTKHVPVVVMTSSDLERDVIEGYRRGANSFVTKPVDFDEFSKAVKQIGMYWLILNHPPPAD